MTTTPDTTPANAERLLKLRQAVVDAPLEQFDMQTWSCGTRACAAGHYIIRNPDCGIELRNDLPGSPRRYPVPVGYTGDMIDVDDVGMFAEHFGINRGVTYDLFYRDCHDEPFSGEEGKSEFLAKLDALLAARGIAAPAGAPK